jgi:hypothetical protein
MFTSLFHKLSLFALLITTNFTLWPSIAHAYVYTPPTSTNYQSTSGTTKLYLSNSDGTNSNKSSASYQTNVNGEIWSGNAQFTRVLGQNGNRALYGTFKDYAGNTGRPPYDGTIERSCTGNLTASQTTPNDRYQLKATWNVTGGKNCTAIGKTYNLDLSEAIPIADAKGDFQLKNTATWGGLDSGQNDFHTWDRWQIVDDSLNCRIRPNSDIVRTYRRGDQVESRYDGRGTASAILGADNTESSPSIVFSGKIQGPPWILTRDGCYVRSNSQYIQPLSCSQPFKP